MKHLGDITKIDGSRIEKVDCIVGGSPCQDLSVAGKRAGLSGERSGLFMEQIRIIKEMREHDRSVGRADVDLRPRWGIWENVPGATSSGTPKGEDFRIVLEEFARVSDPSVSIPLPEDGWSRSGFIVGNHWSIAWRIIDAQFWGVPQRRRRIHLLADFNGTTAPYILLCDGIQSKRKYDNSRGESSFVGSTEGCTEPLSFERESLSGNFESCITPWKGVASNPEERLGECNTLKIRGGGTRQQRTESREGSVDSEGLECDHWMQSGSNAFLTDRNRL